MEHPAASPALRPAGVLAGFPACALTGTAVSGYGLLPEHGAKLGGVTATDPAGRPRASRRSTWAPATGAPSTTSLSSEWALDA